jgi:hypothetical protein
MLKNWIHFLFVGGEHMRFEPQIDGTFDPSHYSDHSLDGIRSVPTTPIKAAMVNNSIVFLFLEHTLAFYLPKATNSEKYWFLLFINQLTFQLSSYNNLKFWACPVRTYLVVKKATQRFSFLHDLVMFSKWLRMMPLFLFSSVCTV